MILEITEKHDKYKKYFYTSYCCHVGVQYWILNRICWIWKKVCSSTFVDSNPVSHNMDNRRRLFAKFVLGQELRRIWYNNVWQNKTKQKERNWKKNGNDLFIIWMEFLSNWDNEKATYLADTFMGFSFFQFFIMGCFFFNITRYFFFLQLK
jgi:hypothetical protein